jgi:glutamine synthetase
VLALEAMGFHVEAAHHEVAPGQHEIDFSYDDVLATADNISTFRFVVKNVAMRHDLHATFMPKPCSESTARACTRTVSVSGGKNIFFEPEGPLAAESDVPVLHRRSSAPREGVLRDHQSARELVQAARARLRGADEHRLVERNRSPLVRVPAARGEPRGSSCGCPTRRAIRISRWR